MSALDEQPYAPPLARIAGNEGFVATSRLGVMTLLLSIVGFALAIGRVAHDELGAERSGFTLSLATMQVTSTIAIGFSVAGIALGLFTFWRDRRRKRSTGG